MQKKKKGTSLDAKQVDFRYDPQQVICNECLNFIHC